MGRLLVAIDLKAGKILWRARSAPRKTARRSARVPLRHAARHGVAITAGGLVFIGAMDEYVRAFDAKTGEELWPGRLPVTGDANP